MLEVHSVGDLGMSEHKQPHQSASGGVDSSKNYKPLSSGGWNHHNSAEDPDIASTPPGKVVASNTRTHPQADLRDAKSTRGSADVDHHKKAWHGSNHVHNHVMREGGGGATVSVNGKRRRSKDSDDGGEVWTEHVSSSGRSYFYNKRLDKSQWERPKGMLKRAKNETTPSTHKTDATPSSHKTDATPSTRKTEATPSTRKTEAAPSSRKTGVAASTPLTKTPHHEGTRGERGRGHSHTDGHRDSGRSSKHGENHSKHHGERGDRVKGHDSRHHSRKSRSLSGSFSPPSVGVGGPAKQQSNKTTTTSSSTRTNNTLERSRKTPGHSSPVSTPKGSGIQLISPTTPGSQSFPANISHTLSTTKQLIDHTSILLEQQQRFLAGEATPTTVRATPTITNCISAVPATPPTHHMQPLAKKRLSLTPQMSPSYSTPSSFTPVAHYTLPHGGVVTHGGVVPPHTTIDNSGLHPLQRALLLQNQKTLHEGVEPIPQTPPTAIPHHMTPGPQSCSSSPILQSPGIPGYSVQPLTPLQSNIFVMPQPTFDPTVLPQQHCLNSKALQRPVSKLAYLNSSPELLQFPNAGGLDRLGGSQFNMDLVDKDLANIWLQHNQVLAKQVMQGQLDTLRRRTVDSFYLSGQFVKRHLAVSAGQVKSTSRNQRLRQLRALIQDLTKR